MPKYKMVAFSKPKPGGDAAYNDWYNNAHLKEICSAKGIKVGKRYKLAMNLTQSPHFLQYLAIYDVETDNLGETLKEMGEKGTTRSDAMDYDSASLAFYEES